MYLTQALSRVEARPTEGRLECQAYPPQTLWGRCQHGCQEDPPRHHPGLGSCKLVQKRRRREEEEEMEEEVRRGKEKTHTANI